MKTKIFILVQKIIKHELITGSFFVFFGSMLANVFAFLFNLLLARKLTYIEYGEYVAIISLYSLFVIPSTSLGNILVKFATEFHAKKENHKLTTFFYSSTKVIGVLSISIILVFIFLQGVLKDFLHLPNALYMVFVGILILISYLSMVNTAFMQSLLKFNFVAVTVVVSSAAKLILGAVFIFAGLRIFGVFGALILSAALTYFFSFYPISNIIFGKKEKTVIQFGNITSYALPATITLLALSFFITTDLLLVKHFFSGKDAGIYSGLSLVGKIIFYFTGPIPGVMFPLLIKRLHKGENIINLFALSLLLVLFPGLLITSFYYLFPTFIINFFLGGKGYLVATSYVGLFGLFITLFSVINVLVNFFLSTGKTKIVFVLLGGAITQAVLIWVFHKDFTQVIYASIFSSLVVLVLLLLYYGKTYANFRFFKKTIPFFNNPSV